MKTSRLLYMALIFVIFALCWRLTSRSSQPLAIPILSPQNCLLEECLQNLDPTPPSIDPKKAQLLRSLLIATDVLEKNARQTSEKYAQAEPFATFTLSETKNLQYLYHLKKKYLIPDFEIVPEVHLPQHESLLSAFQKTLSAEESRQRLIKDEILPNFDSKTDLGRLAESIFTDSKYYHVPTLRRFIQVYLPSPTSPPARR